MFMNGLLIYCVLFLAGLLFFVLGQKIKFSFVPGIIVTEIAGFSFMWSFVLEKPGPTKMLLDVIRLINSTKVLKIEKLNLIALSLFVCAPVICVAFYFIGKLIGKLIFKGTKNRTKLAKVLYNTASVMVLFTGIFQALNSLTLTPESFAKFSNLSSLFIVLSRIRIVFGYLLVSAKHAMLVGIILVITGLICVILINTKLPMFKKAKEQEII